MGNSRKSYPMERFHYFVQTVLKKKAIENSQEIYFESPWIEAGEKSVSKFRGKELGSYYYFDAIAPNGFGKLQGHVIFEIKSRFQKNESLNKAIEELYKKAQYNTRSDRKIHIIFIVNDWLTTRHITDYSDKDYDCSIWDLDVIDEWRVQYPIDYNNTVGYEAVYESYYESRYTSAFHDNNGLLIQSTRQCIRRREPFAIVLGAGVSVDQGAKSWDDLLNDLKSDIENQNKLDDADKVFDMVGGTSLTTAQMCKDVYTDDLSFVWKIHNSLYREEKPLSQESELSQIAKIAGKCKDNRRFRILTYNYDDFLERYLDRQDIDYCSLFSVKEHYVDGTRSTDLYNMEGDVNENLLVYHVHGFLPKVKYKKDVQKVHERSICLTEADYHLLYNQPYSWPIVSQLSFFRENICLFIGCSLKDPNIRRLLEITASIPPKHFAFLTKEDLTLKDQMQVTAHFFRIGVNIIWVDRYTDIPILLKHIYDEI